WEYLAVDDFRRKHSDGTIKGDSKTKSLFVKSITHTDDISQIIECTGLGRLGSSVRKRIQKFEGRIVVLVLMVEKDICLKRLEKRVWDVPFPENITRGNDLLDKMDKIFQSSFLHERWGVLPNVEYLQLRHETLEQQKTIIEIITLLIRN
ncbi:MAG: hypothetical protein ACPG5P_07465, partial [Saprospiraceae bacterium]